MFHSDRAALLWDATAVPNAFLIEYMPSAPDAYVKVYLYALMYVHAGHLDNAILPIDIANALSQTVEEVEMALRYFERCRLLDRISSQPPSYRFFSAQQALITRQNLPEDTGYIEFAQALYAIFGEKRKLHGGETVLAYEWVEQLRIPPEVVLMLVQHMVATRGIRFSFKEAQKLAVELSEQDIRTLESAETFFSRSEAAWKGTKKILTRLGKRRDPSQDEIDLYVKWTIDWQYQPKAIESACQETTKGEPTLAYLDRILEGIRNRSDGKSLRAMEVEKQLEQERNETSQIREMLSALGIKTPIVDEGKRLIYRHFTKIANHDVIMLAATEIGKRRGKHSTEDIEALILSWQKKQLTTHAQVSGYLATVDELNRRLREIYEIAGRECGLTQPNREALKRWQEIYHQPANVIDAAAAYSRNVSKPIPYIDKLLSQWHASGIHTLDAAMADHERFVADVKSPATSTSNATTSTQPKRVIEQLYSQRNYDPAEYDIPTPEMLEEVNRN